MHGKRSLALGTAAVLLLFCGLIYAWSLFRSPFQQMFPSWNLQQLSMIFTISMICFCFGGFLSGRLLMKRSVTLVISLSSLLVLIGFFGVSMISPQNPRISLVILYLCYGVLGGTGIGLSYNAILSTIGKLFPDNSGFASGIMMMGFGLGGLVLGSAVTGMIAAAGLFKSFRILAVSMFLVLLAGAQMIGKLSGINHSASPDAAGTALPVGYRGKNMSAGGMLRTGAFWIFILWNVVTNSAGLMVMNSAASIAAVFGAPAVMGMMVSLFNGFGRVLIGGIYDRYGRGKTMALDCVLQIGSGVLLVWGAVLSMPVLIIIGLLLAGLFYGGSPTIAASFIKREYGDKYYSVNFSVANFSLVPAALIGPTLSSALIEAADGSYMTTFTMIAVCGIISISTLPLLKKQSGKILLHKE